jgi:pimeloyl-ACP methyl ester carboxylesterase
MIRTVLLGILLALSAATGAVAQERWRSVPALPAMPVAASSGYVGTNGARIYYATYGKGPPVVLLHGGLANSNYWAGQIGPLARQHRVIVIDSRGHGRSSRDARPYSYELMAGDVLAVMDELGIRKSAIVGWSDGAIIGLVLAMQHPARVTRVFAFAANMDPSGVELSGTERPPFSTFVERARADYARLSPTPDGFDAFLGAIGKMWEHEPNYKAADLATIRVPVAIVDGDRDEVIKAEHTRYLARSIPRARLIWLRDLSHFALLQDPAAFNAAVLGFLDG